MENLTGEENGNMGEGRRVEDNSWKKLSKWLPIVLALCAGVFGYGRLSARVDSHEQLLVEVRADIKELLRRVR